MADEKIISKDEMATLLDNSIERVPVTAEIAKDGIPVNFYDFVSEYHKGLTRSRGFNVVNNNFSNALRLEIFRLLRKKAFINPLEADIASFGSYFEKYPRKAAISLFRVQGSNSHLMISLDSACLVAFIEILFGGNPEHSKNLHHEFGQIDIKVAELLSKHIITCLQSAWACFTNFQFDHIETTTDQILPGQIPNNENAVIQKYKISLDSLTTEAHICFPYALLQNVSHLLEHDEAKDLTPSEASWFENLKHNVHHSNINLSAHITETELPLRDVVNLKAGDIIAIDDPKFGYLLAENTPLFKVKCGLKEGKKVVEILQSLND